MARFIPATLPRRTALMFAVLVVVAPALAMAPPAHGATFTVDTTADIVDALDGLTSLREAVSAANASPGDDEIVLPAGTFTLTIGGPGDNANVRGDLDHVDATGNLAIRGAGAGTSTITTSIADRILHMRVGSVSLEGLTIEGGRVQTGAGVYVVAGNLVATDVAFDDNTTTGTRSGGAARVTGSLTATNVTLTGNEARDGGGFFVRNGSATLSNLSASANTARRHGGVVNTNRSLTITDSSFTSNGAATDGGVARVGADPASTITLTNVTATTNTAGRDGAVMRVNRQLTVNGGTFSSNNSTRRGGVIWASAGVTLTGGSYDSNSAGNAGGALHTGNASPVAVTGATFNSNSAAATGGALRAGREPASITDTTFTNNTAAGRGGAIWIDDRLTVTTSTFTTNRSTGSDGGAIWAQRRPATITGSAFTGNTARDGGAVRVAAGATLDSVTMASNAASRYGGALRAVGTVTASNTTISGNSATTSGGGIRGERVDLIHVTVVANSAPTAANVQATDLRPSSSVFALGAGGGTDCVASATTSAGGNFDGDGTCGLGGSDISAGGDPLLAPLAANGGPTRTRLPLPTSQLLDAAPTATAFDQRGIARPQGVAADTGGTESRIPTAIDDVASKNEDTSVIIDVVANDDDPDNLITDSAVVATTFPANGVTVDNGDGTITYTPDTDWNGIDSFDYMNGFATATATVTVDPVNDAPVAVDDPATTDEDTAVVLDVLGNDTDVDGDTLSVSSVSDPADGSTVANGDGTITYTPDPDWNGIDTFSYEVDDGNAGTATASVTVTVDPVNDAPAALPDASFAIVVAEDDSITFDPTIWFGDIDGDPISVVAVGAAGHGDTSGSVTYTPNPDYNGPDAFSVTVADGNGGTVDATVAVTVTPLDDPPIVTDEMLVVGNASATTIDVLANDYDPDGDPLSLSILDVTHGTALVLDNKIVFTPPEAFVGEAVVTYQVAANGLSTVGTATLLVEAELPVTGLSTDVLGVLGMLLITVGLALLIATRRRPA